MLQIIKIRLSPISNEIGRVVYIATPTVHTLHVSNTLKRLG